MSKLEIDKSWVTPRMRSPGVAARMARLPWLRGAICRVELAITLLFDVTLVA
jgi:hypothetical protein